MTEINYKKVAKLRPEKLLKTGKQIKRNVVSLITKNERGISFVKLLTVVISLLPISLSLPTLSPGADLKIQQEIYHYQIAFAKIIPCETFVISTALNHPQAKAVISPQHIQPPSAAPAHNFTNPIIVHFQLDSAEIDTAERTRLLSLFHELEVPQTAPLAVTGYTCKMGPHIFNLWLSKERAKTVSALLEEKGYSVVKVEGKGATNFASDNYAPFNRRVEITPFETNSAHLGQHQISTKEETP